MHFSIAVRRARSVRTGHLNDPIGGEGYARSHIPCQNDGGPVGRPPNRFLAVDDLMPDIISLAFGAMRAPLQSPANGADGDVGGGSFALVRARLLERWT